MAAIVEKVANYATRILTQNIPHTLSYHNYSHTRGVVNGVKAIGRKVGLTPEEMEVVMVAAWLHDTGFKDTYSDHETASKKIAEEFLVSLGYDQAKIQKVKGCIEATRLPQSPTNRMEEVICDADFIHCAKDGYFEILDGLREEWKAHLNKQMTDLEWHEMNEKFLNGHSFFTQYGKRTLKIAKDKNVERQQSLLHALKGN